MWEGIPLQGGSAEPHEDPLRGNALHVLLLRQELQEGTQHEEARALPHQGKRFQLLTVRQELRLQGDAGQTRADPLGREAVPLLRLREGLLFPR